MTPEQKRLIKFYKSKQARFQRYIQKLEAGNGSYGDITFWMQRIEDYDTMIARVATGLSIEVRA